MKVFIYECVVFVSLLGFIDLEATRASVIEKMDYMGWEDCYRLANNESEVIIVPSIGRVVVFRQIGKSNVFQFYKDMAGKVRGETDPFIQYGGLYTWLAPQDHWQLTTEQKQAEFLFFPPLDALPHEVVVINHNEGSITIARKDPNNYGLSIEKIYSISEQGSILNYKVIVTNLGNVPIQWSTWNLAAVPLQGRLIFEAPNGWDEFQFIMHSVPSAKAYKPYIKFFKTLAVVDLDAIQTNGSKAFVKPNGSYLIHYMPNYWLVRRFSKPKYSDLFTDKNSQIELWMNRKEMFAETEVLSPCVLLQPGNTFSWEEEFSIVPTKVIPLPSDLFKLDEVIRVLINGKYDNTIVD